MGSSNRDRQRRQQAKRARRSAREAPNRSSWMGSEFGTAGTQSSAESIIGGAGFYLPWQPNPHEMCERDVLDPELYQVLIERGWMPSMREAEWGPGGEIESREYEWGGSVGTVVKVTAQFHPKLDDVVTSYTYTSFCGLDTDRDYRSRDALIADLPRLEQTAEPGHSAN